MPLAAIGSAWPLLLGMGVLMLGAGLQSTLLGVRATQEQFAAQTIGVVMSCYYVGYLFGTMLAPRLVRSVGHIRVFAAFAAVASAATLFQAISVNPWSWGAMRLLSGLCFAGIYVVAESWLNERALPENRSRLFAIYMVVLYVGLGSAQFLLTLWDPRSAGPFMLVSALISLAMVPLVVSAHSAPVVERHGRVRIADLFRTAPLGVGAVATAGVITSIVFSIGPVYARLSGLDTTGIATFMAASIFAGVVSQYPIGMIADRLDRRVVLAGVCAAATLAAGMLVVAPQLPTLWFLSLSAVVSGLVLTIYSLGVSHVNDRLDPGQMVEASSALLLMNGLGAIAGPLLAGVLLSAFGPGAYFATLGSLTGALTLYCLWRRLRRLPVPPDLRGPFRPTQPEPCASIDEPLPAGPASRATAAAATAE
ncbi:MAG: MFS transporter [Proteobacteria bacterium]|nr:MFS transporter [Pseudomonadota bacterium]